MEHTQLSLCVWVSWEKLAIYRKTLLLCHHSEDQSVISIEGEDSYVD